MGLRLQTGSDRQGIPLAPAGNGSDSSSLAGRFLAQYSAEETVRRYLSKTAGRGISYLLDHDYGRIYLECIEKHVVRTGVESGIRLWEFGCGGAMNLCHLVSTLERRGIPVEFACGTDFSESLITAARNEVRNYITPELAGRLRLGVANNEDLVEQGSKSLGVAASELLGSFDVVLGVNTIRYGHRLKNVDRCVRGIHGLLREGGICITIDMNRNFPAFRSRLRERPRPNDKATYLPTLDEYARPFSAAGFEILTKENFCWIPHSAGPVLTTVMVTVSPILNVLAPSRAMRSLVISRKPGGPC